ncbi:MAG: terminase large subunit [Acetatifactor muris]|nr:terminase large subunit [Acetatifactor muris]
MTSRKSYSRYLEPYIRRIQENEAEHCAEQEQMLDNIVLPVLAREDVVFREDKVEDGLSLQKYFPYRLNTWEIFLFALIVGLETTDGDCFFHDIRIYVGRGSGKNGFISFLCFYFISPYHGIKGYNVDLLANSEKQVMTSYMDVYNVIKDPEEPKYKSVLKQHYSATMETITGKVTKSELRYNTSSKRGKDSKRTGCVIFDEKHEYLDETNINTLKSGLGKIAHPREITISTDGHIRDAVFDREKEQSRDILKEYNPDNRTLVFWCRIESEDEWNRMDKLEKAIPSLNEPGFESLRATIQKEIMDMPYSPDYYPEFLTKRCNFPVGNTETEVASWEDIVATTQDPVPDLRGMPCVGAIDYAKTNDFVAVMLLFKWKGYAALVQHTFICRRSRDLKGIKAPLEEWVQRGDAEWVDDVEIPPELVAGWFGERMEEYNILKIAIDNFRYALMNRALKEVGFDAFEKKNVVLTHKWDVVKAAPVINSLFVTHRIIAGDVPIWRWYVRNTKKVQINGNISYAKIEQNFRKTDGFMAFVAGMTIYDEIPEDEDVLVDLAVYAY